MSSHHFSRYFLNPSADALSDYSQAMSDAKDLVVNFLKDLKQPYQGLEPKLQFDTFKAVDYFPEAEGKMEQVLATMQDLVLKNSLSVINKRCLAHLHCPVLLPSLIAEAVISATNQSMDSWDQAPGASMLEQCFTEQLCELFGYNADSDGVFTSGGTQSNFMGIMLARDFYCKERLGWEVQKRGLPPDYSKLRILCSDVAHFSVIQSAAILGLGHDSVVLVATDEHFRMKPDALEATMSDLLAQGLMPFCLVATAGTTDFGSIDPIDALAACANKYGLWLHVDAAFGGALAISDKHRDKLVGIGLADSITIDFHKLFFQSISCSAFLIKDKSRFGLMNLNADYLNPEHNRDLGILDLVYKSIQTTRRFDVLKPFLTFQLLGRKKMAEIIDYTLDLAQHTAAKINADARFELMTQPYLNSLVFRYLPADESTADAVNTAIKIALLLSGEAVIGQTVVRGHACLKFTLMNPLTTPADVDDLLELVAAQGEKALGELSVKSY